MTEDYIDVEEFRKAFPLFCGNLVYVDCSYHWKKLLWNMCAQIEEECKTFIPEDNNCGWCWNSKEICGTDGQKSHEFRSKTPGLEECKSKFGSLRVYTNEFSNDKIEQFIKEAEDLADKTCELCGSLEGKAKSIHYWIYLICKDCEDKENVKQK